MLCCKLLCNPVEEIALVLLDFGIMKFNDFLKKIRARYTAIMKIYVVQSWMSQTHVDKCEVGMTV